MPGKAAKVLISERQEEVLRELASSRTVAVRLAQRARIILLAFAGWLNEKIALEVRLGRQAVGHWRLVWAASFGWLIRVECGEGPLSLRQAIEQVLNDAPRCGCPGKFTAEQLTQILAVACEPPEKSGRPITHWTYAELADEVIGRGIVESISASQVGRYLRDAVLQPHKSRYWLNSKEKDPELFQVQVEMVCACYQDAPALYSQHDTHTYCVDEMTGIQALQRIAATLPARPGRTECREFEYARHGTLSLIANFDVVTGEMVSPSLGPTRTEEDFVRHIERTIDRAPQAGHVFVLDNLNIHQSAGLVRMVARRLGISDDLGKKDKRGVLRSMSSRQEFLGDQGHRIRFVYLPRHTSWLNQIEVVFSVIARKVLRRGSFSSVDDLRTKLLAFIDYFNDVFARPFRWTYTGRPLSA